jgi:FkbM family methyltransferase
MRSNKTVTLKTKRGFILDAFEGDSITNEIQKKGEYDSNTLNSISVVLAAIKPQVSLDVGANIGNHAMVIAQYSKQLIAFEPIKFIYDVLKKNINNNLQKQIAAVNLGLSDVTANRQISIPLNNNLGSSSIENAFGDGDLLAIETVLGDVYLQNLKLSYIDFIKIDIEGHEANALQGLKETIQTQQPLILMEYNSQHTIDSFKKFDLFNRLLIGYSFYSLSYTHNKKVHANNFLGILKRIYYKYFNQSWCLSSFNPNQSYANVYFVPTRYAAYFKTLKYLNRN